MQRRLPKGVKCPPRSPHDNNNGRDESLHDSPSSKRAKTVLETPKYSSGPVPRGSSSSTSPVLRTPPAATKAATPSCAPCTPLLKPYKPDGAEANGADGQETPPNQGAPDGEKTKMGPEDDWMNSDGEAAGGEGATPEQGALDWEDEHEDMEAEEEDEEKEGKNDLAASDDPASGGRLTTPAETVIAAKRRDAMAIGLPAQMEFRLRLEVARLNARRERLQMVLKTMEVILSTVAASAPTG